MKVIETQKKKPSWHLALTGMVRISTDFVFDGKVNLIDKSMALWILGKGPEQYRIALRQMLVESASGGAGK